MKNAKTKIDPIPLSPPKGWTFDRLKRAPSVLYRDSSLHEDLLFIDYLVGKIVISPIRLNHRNECVWKIFNKVTTPEWKNKYRSAMFVFCIANQFDVRISDIKTMLSCQALENIFHFEFQNDKEVDFGNKIMKIYKKIYDMDFSKDAANVLRIIRNNLAHSGLTEGIDEKYKPRELEAINEITERLEFNDSTIMLRSVAFEFEYLMEDILVRMLGLGWDELGFNGRPPCMSNYFRLETNLITSQ